MTMTPPSTSKTTSARPGKAGRTDYDAWNKVTNDLLEETQLEEEQEKQRQAEELGLDGKYAVSQADAEEREKSQRVEETRKALEVYQKRESSIMESMSGLFAGSADDSGEAKSDQPQIIRITRQNLEAGKRVVTISDTSGQSQQDTIVLTQDLSQLESKYRSANVQAKSFDGDAENKVVEDTTERKVHGIIKLFLTHLENCTVLIKCKVISGTVEISHCNDIKVVIEQDATVPTVQVDLCQNLVVEFKDAKSGKHVPMAKTKFWGDDADDRIFHAGVKNMVVKCIRDGYCEYERTCDYIQDDAQEIGNASKEEYQFVTSVVDDALVTEAVVRSGATTGENSRAMTQRELEAEKKKRERAAKVAVGMADDMIKVLDKDGNPLAKKVDAPAADGAPAEEIPEDVKDIIQECETNKSRGNDAFKAGEYGQAILLYSLALDKSDELATEEDKKKFPRDVVLSNRAACFLKLGQHDKALEDGKAAAAINPTNVKAIFRQGLALHAMKEYQQALPILAKALKLEPTNKQIQQAIQFAEVRMQQEMRKRMEG
eukprot:CAMPEP_0119546700 /NCGR_PEP_ID=MMETSP1352-20130426/1004_1 /TAXON_ID=265584 /ORGANISM="Stauroneis constricta, Strain CCMP1120" /LENGTH=544 /DNA_ID=CAMNT_0007591425 /DNA_START=105 /DNA_END=1739 /DNA_ORIENTATION=+